MCKIQNSESALDLAPEEAPQELRDSRARCAALEARRGFL